MPYIWNSLKHKYKPIASFVKCASEVSMEKPAPKLLEKVREVLRLKHYSPKTEESYVHWIRQLSLLSIARRLAGAHAIHGLPRQVAREHHIL